jgi:hypothetical protein
MRQKHAFVLADQKPGDAAVPVGCCPHSTSRRQFLREAGLRGRRPNGL